jgi:hypothetical protein
MYDSNIRKSIHKNNETFEDNLDTANIYSNRNAATSVTS